MCDCGCGQTTVNCTCPETTGIEALQINNVISASFGAGEDIFNAGNGYTYTVYTNSSSNSQFVLVNANMQITCTVTHDISSTYSLNAVPPLFNHQFQDNAPTKTDYTDFSDYVTMAPGDVLKLTVKSSDANGKLIWLQAFVYKYDL